jgi:flagellar FliJ protein
MAAFKFRLEPVVNLKKRAEDKRKIALAHAKKDLDRNQTHLVNLCDRRDTCRSDEWPAGAEGSLDKSAMLIYYAYMEKMAEEIANQTCAVERSKADVEAKRELLIESSREKRTLEKLRERMRHRYLYELNKAEQASLDETAGRLHCRTTAGKPSWKERE